MATDRFYDSPAWRKLRAAKLSAQPLCEPCLAAGIITPATVVDHIHARHLGGPDLPSLAGLRSMDIGCHNFKSSRVDHNDRVIRRHVKGFDLAGYPLDTPPPSPMVGGLKDGADSARGPAATRSVELFPQGLKPRKKMVL
jgi:hypothetical protein